MVQTRDKNIYNIKVYFIFNGNTLEDVPPSRDIHAKRRRWYTRVVFQREKNLFIGFN